MAAITAPADAIQRAAQATRKVAGAWAAALLTDAFGTRKQNSCGILMYHRVTNVVPGLPTPTWNVSPQRFKQQLTGLLRRGYTAWPLRKVLEYRRRKLSLPDRVFVVTFDDGYENNYTQAFPILRALKIPATIFLATSFIGSPEPLPFDDWSAKGTESVPPESWRALTLEQCREMQASGLIDFGAHTHTHQDFRGRSDTFRADLHECLVFLQQQLGYRDATFAFPYGMRKQGFSGPAMARVVREVGFLCALTTEWQLADLSGDCFDWGRLTAEQSDTAATLAGKLSGWFSSLRRGLASMKRLLRPIKPIASTASSLTKLTAKHSR